MTILDAVCQPDPDLSATIRTHSIAELKADASNPREIDEPALVGLGVSLADFGDLSGIVWNWQTGELVAGHQRVDRLNAAGATEWKEDHAGAYIEHPVTGERFPIRIVDWPIEKQRAANLVANNPTIQGTFTRAALEQLEQLRGHVHAEALRLPEMEAHIRAQLEDLRAKQKPAGGRTDPDAIPDVPRAPVTKPGDLWRLGDHYLICGDTTIPEVVARVAAVAGGLLAMHHADPPYGMGKEKDGVANDNLYEDKLDDFQIEWWRAWLPWLAPNGSAYVWGNAPDLWRLWWRKLSLLEPRDLHVRNEIVWDKGSAIGMRSEDHHCFPTGTERALFFMRGEQFLGNQNKEDFFEGYEPLRAWLEAQRTLAGWTNGDVNKLTGTFMAGHWFSRSQFMPISPDHYDTLARAANGRAFVESYDALFQKLFPDARAGGNEHRRDLAAKLREGRSFFDNQHEAMSDVWSFGRVVGAERFGHATPKPVAMVERAIKSSSRVGDVVGVPFAGTGPEFIACTSLERRAVGAELNPAYCDVVVERWQAFTGGHAEKA